MSSLIAHTAASSSSIGNDAEYIDHRIRARSPNSPTAHRLSLETSHLPSPSCPPRHRRRLAPPSSALGPGPPSSDPRSHTAPRAPPPSPRPPPLPPCSPPAPASSISRPRSSGSTVLLRQPARISSPPSCAEPSRTCTTRAHNAARSQRCTLCTERTGSCRALCDVALPRGPRRAAASL